MYVASEDRRSISGKSGNTSRRSRSISIVSGMATVVLALWLGAGNAGGQTTPKSARIPPGPVPNSIDPVSLRKVKKATAYLRVTDRDGRESQGSGFFAINPGIVFTNAHVLGMLDLNAPPPTSIEVIIQSGEADESKRAGTVLGVDREADLAVIQVQGAVAGLPDPLPVDTSAGLTELQKVYAFGFPYGKALGKNITVGESSISSIRKETDGSVYQIQMNGGLNPGNSGGPVVDARGVVVGVSVSAIIGTQLGFAVPGDKVLGLVNGRVQDMHLGYAYSDKGQVKLPVSIVCLDPLKRIRTLEVEVWTGPAGKTRPPSVAKPASVPGDGTRQTIAVKYQEGKGTQDLILPALPLKAGQMVWVQPIVTGPTGSKNWSSAQAYERSDSPPLERAPAQLVAKVDPGERTLKINSRSMTLIARGREKLAEVDEMSVDVLESLSASPRGAKIRLLCGNGQHFEEFDGKKGVRNPEAYAAIKNHVHGFECGPDVALSSFGFANFTYKNNLRKTEDANDMAAFFVTSYQLSSLPFPNRSMQPGDTWTPNIRLLLGRGKKKTVLDVALKCTYDGQRTTAGKQEAVASLEGEVKILKSERPILRKPTDRVTGFAVFDIEKGFVSQLEISLRDEREINGLIVTNAFALSLTRSAGNTLGIVMPPEKGPAVVGNPMPDPKVAPPNPKGTAKDANEAVLGGGFGRDPYKDVAPEGAVLVGMEIGLGKFGRDDVVQAVRTVFRKGDMDSNGPQHGTNLTRVKSLVAKAGYAVGAITLKVGANVDGISITFMRLKDGRLDPMDSYESEFIGDQRPGHRMLTGNGRLVIGVAGLQSKTNNTGIGLVYGP